MDFRAPLRHSFARLPQCISRTNAERLALRGGSPKPHLHPFADLLGVDEECSTRHEDEEDNFILFKLEVPDNKCGRSEGDRRHRHCDTEPCIINMSDASTAEKNCPWALRATKQVWVSSHCIESRHGSANRFSSLAVRRSGPTKARQNGTPLPSRRTYRLRLKYYGNCPNWSSLGPRPAMSFDPP
jgi:hypothetical protein